MAEIIMRKNNLDLIAGLKTLSFNEHDRWFNMHDQKVDLNWPGVSEVYPAFLINETGFFGRGVFLISIAFDIGIFGIPTKTVGIEVDGRKSTTAGFVQHDFGHINWLLNTGETWENIPGEITKKEIIKSGAFRNFLLKTRFSKKNIDWIDGKFRESISLSIDCFDLPNNKLLINFYRACLDPQSPLTDEEILTAIYSFKGAHFTYGIIPFLLRHVKNIEETKEIILARIKPESILLQRMQAWGILTIPSYHRDNANPSEFLRLLATLECGGVELLNKIDEMHKLGIFRFNYMADFEHFYYIKCIITCLKNLSDDEIQEMLKEEPAILETLSLKKRSELISAKCLRRK